MSLHDTNNEEHRRKETPLQRDFLLGRRFLFANRFFVLSAINSCSVLQAFDLKFAIYAFPRFQCLTALRTFCKILNFANFLRSNSPAHPNLTAVRRGAWRERRRSAMVATSALIVATAGLYLVWVPSHASTVADWVGVGRGVDLIIYVWVVISLLVLLNMHLKLWAQLELITALARQIAIANAKTNSPGMQEASAGIE
jgi:small membrane protein